MLHNADDAAVHAVLCQSSCTAVGLDVVISLETAVTTCAWM